MRKDKVSKSLCEKIQELPSISELAETVAKIAASVDQKYPPSPGVHTQLVKNWRGNWVDSQLPSISEVSYGRVVQGNTRWDNDAIVVSSKIKAYSIKGSSSAAPDVELTMDFEFNQDNTIFVPKRNSYLAFILSPEGDDLIWFGTQEWSYETNHPKYAVLKLMNCEIIN